MGRRLTRALALDLLQLKAVAIYNALPVYKTNNHEVKRPINEFKNKTNGHFNIANSNIFFRD